MIAKKSVLFVGALLVGASVVATTAGDAWAAKTKKKKESFVCKLNNKTYKANIAASIVASYASQTHGLIINANAKYGSGFKTKIAQFVIAGGGIDIPNTTSFPVNLTSASATYSIGGIGGTPQGWSSDTQHAVTVTITGFDTTTHQVFGTFSGTMGPGETSTGNLTVSNGKFVIDMLIDGH